MPNALANAGPKRDLREDARRARQAPGSPQRIAGSALRHGEFQELSPELVSPELALVDPELARRERRRLSEQASRTGLRAVPAAPQPIMPDPGVMIAPGPLAPPSPDPSPSPRAISVNASSFPGSSRASAVLTVPRYRRAALVLTTCALTVAAGLLVAPRGEPGEQAAADLPARVTAAKDVRSSASPPLPVSHAAATTAAKTLAWAPASGAVGYEVQLFRGARRVLLMRTSRPSLQLGSSWRYEGRLVRRQGGTYRWYVWPLFQGNRRASAAIVQTRVVI